MKKRVTKADISKYVELLKDKLLQLDDSNYSSTKDVVIEIRVAWEALQRALFDRKLDNYSKVLKSLDDLAFITTYATLYVTRHMKMERDEQLGIEEKPARINISDNLSDVRVEKKKKKPAITSNKKL